MYIYVYLFIYLFIYIYIYLFTTPFQVLKSTKSPDPVASAERPLGQEKAGLKASANPKP